MSAITAKIREESGTGSARAIRRTNMLPAIVYGGSKKPQSLIVDPRDIMRGLNKEGFYSTVAELEIDGKTEKVIPKAVQFHPVNDQPLHADFLRVTDKTVVTVSVPVHFRNKEKCRGIKMGGSLNIIRHDVEVTCLANKIPESFSVDLEAVKMGESVKSSALELPAGVKFSITDRDFTIVNVAVPRGMTAEEQREAEGGDDAEETASAE